jgi:antitoxin component of MazEF toxin-antitoxin module
MAFKLRKIGNSNGTTFSQEILNAAGFKPGQLLDMMVSPGEIKIVPAVESGVMVVFTADEAQAVATGQLDTQAGLSALNKVRKGLDG